MEAQVEEAPVLNPALSSPQLPPLGVPLRWGGVPTEHAPPPLVNQIAEREEGDLVQGSLHQEVDVTF